MNKYFLDLLVCHCDTNLESAPGGGLLGLSTEEIFRPRGEHKFCSPVIYHDGLEHPYKKS